MPFAKPPLGSVPNRSHPLGRDLICCLLLNEGGGQRLFDVADRRETGLITGAAWSSSGRTGRGLSFNGSTDNVLLSDATKFLIERTQPFSFSVWLRSAAINPSTVQFIFTNEPTTENNRGFGFDVRGTATNDPYRASLRSSAAPVCFVDFPRSNDTNLHHVVITYAGTGVGSGFAGYEDGKLLTPTIGTDTLGANTIIPTACTPQLGNRAGNTLGFNGFIESFRMYGRALSFAEVRALFLDPYAGIVIPTPWKSVWKFTAGSYSEAVSLSGSSSLSGAAGLAAVGALAPSAAAGYASAPTVAMTAALGLSGVAGATLAGGLSLSGSLTLTVAGAYSGAVVMTFVPSVALSGTAGIDQAVTLTVPGSLALTAASGLSSSSALSTHGALALAGLAAFLANGGQELTATFSASAAAAIAFAPGSVYQGGVTFSAASAIVAALAQTLGAAVTISPTAGFAAAASLSAVGDVVLVAAPGFGTVVAVRFEDAVALSAAGVISPIAVVQMSDGVVLGAVAVFATESTAPFRLPSAYKDQWIGLILDASSVATLVIEDNDPHLEEDV